MKKHLLIAGVALLTTAGVTAAVLSNGKKKDTTKDPSQKESTYKKKCTKARTACF